MTDKPIPEPDSTAVRVALWRALHVEVDALPHVIEDTLGLKLAAPDAGWRTRPDMDAEFTRLFRASIVGRARFVEDLVKDESARGVGQYVILGAGLDTFAQRQPELASRLQVFEIDQPGTQAWKQKRLIELGFGVPSWLHFVPVHFESGASWWEELKRAGFDRAVPAVVASTGVSMYLTKETNKETLRQAATLAPGSTFAMTFLLPMELTPADEKSKYAVSQQGARASGTPFISFYAPEEMLAVAREVGFKKVKCVSGDDLAERYFKGRTDGLKTRNSESILVTAT